MINRETFQKLTADQKTAHLRGAARRRLPRCFAQNVERR